MASDTGESPFFKPVVFSVTEEEHSTDAASFRKPAAANDLKHRHDTVFANKYVSLQPASDPLQSGPLAVSKLLRNASRKRSMRGTERIDTSIYMTTSRAADILEAKDSQSEFTSPDLPLNDIAALSLKMPTRTTGATTGSSQALSSSDEVSQRADFGSDVGTKPPSLDGKSITSGTTFNALDEKESLRPDDSASVKAAADEEDLFSNRGSLLISSRLGSDVAAPMQRIQIGDMLPRVVSHLPQETAVSGVATPQSSASEQQAVTEARVQLASGVVSPSGSKNGQTPDDKLLDAMQTPKDRFFLLRLENDVVNFVQNSKEPFMDLPPSNSFCRMLTHKLADYYHMTHSFEAVAGSVRIYRTPFCRVPPPLSTFVSSSNPNSSTPSTVVQPKKIMRRGEDREMPASAGPSKPTSETSSDSKDKALPAKEKLSREAREEAYIKARERIFGSSGAAEASTPENDDGTGISRASSMSAKDIANANNKTKAGKQRRDDSETFDSRSQYTPYYNHPQQPTWVPPQYMSVENTQFNAAPVPLKPSFSNLFQISQQRQQEQLPLEPQPPRFANGITPQTFDSAATHNASKSQMNSCVCLVTKNAHHFSPRKVPSNLANGFSTNLHSAAGPPITGPLNWQQPQPVYAGTYPQTQSQHGPSRVSIPYAYGQLPVNGNPSDPKGQHPIPGSYPGNYNRHAFNPKTQSFVPGIGAMPLQMPCHQSCHEVARPFLPICHQFTHTQGCASLHGVSYVQPALVTPFFDDSTGSSNRMVRKYSETAITSFNTAQVSLAPTVYQNKFPYDSGSLGSVQNYSTHTIHGVGHVPQNNSTVPGSHRGLRHGNSQGPSYRENPQSYNASAAVNSSIDLNFHGQNTLKHPSISHNPKGATPTCRKLPTYGNPASLPQKPTLT